MCMMDEWSRGMSTPIHPWGGLKLSCGEEPMPSATLEARLRPTYPITHHDPAFPSAPLVDLRWPNRPHDKPFHNLSIAHSEGLA